MRFAILSDIHSNIEALASVLLALYNNNEKIDNLLITGDIVGYGPNPNECCSVVRFLQKGKPGLAGKVKEIIQTIDINDNDRKSVTEYIFSMGKKAFVIVGNHDKAIIGQPSYVSMMALAAGKATQWTTDVLKKENFKFLQSLGYKKKIRKFGIELVHSSPVYPQGWEYPKNAKVLSYGVLMAKITFAGHTHSAAAYLYKKQLEDKPPTVFIPVDQFDAKLMSTEDETSEDPEEVKEVKEVKEIEFDIAMNPDRRYYINPGSVGQPRDGIPKASYMIYDTDTTKVILKRAEYNTEAVKDKIIDAKLPRELATRVIKGA
ncbi:MAG: metallophosphoesterase family protein [Candidatus Anammoxibacter sp.]